jgi:hypothetical protein
MLVYLAARYSRRLEMTKYAGDLQAAGHSVTSRWINGNHQIADEEMEDTLHELKRRTFALDDYSDLVNSECVVSFTELPRSGTSRGGRHVEFGIALALRMPVYVVGHRENVFHCLPQVRFFKTWEQCLAVLRNGTTNGTAT